MKLLLLNQLIHPQQGDEAGYDVFIDTENGPQRISGVQWNHETKRVILKTAVALSLLTPE